MARLDLRPNLSGINEVMKSPGVASLINAQGAKAAARCNSMAHDFSHSAGSPRYASEPVMMSFVAASRVYVANAEAGLDNLRNNTLKKGCGV